MVYLLHDIYYKVICFLLVERFFLVVQLVIHSYL